MRSCPDYRAFKKPYVQTFVRSKLPMSTLLCVPNQKSSAAKMISSVFLLTPSCFQKTLCRDFRALKIAHLRIFECSKPKFARSKTYNCQKITFFTLPFFYLYVVLILSFLNSGPTNLQEGLSCHFQSFLFIANKCQAFDNIFDLELFRILRFFVFLLIN